MYKDKKFSIRPIEEVLEDLHWAKKHYRGVEKIFLADGDALVLPNSTLVRILDEIKILFPECRRVGVYGSPQDVLRKTPDELKELLAKGISIIYIGAESGSNKVLKDIKKGATAEELVEAVRKIEDSGIQASVTFISGIAGQDGWREHAIETGKVISKMEPSYIGLLTLMIDPAAEIYKDINSGKFKLLTAYEVLLETKLMLENIDVKKKCTFRSNHASNYLSLAGDLPRDKEKMLKQIASAEKNSGLLKDERFRML